MRRRCTARPPETQMHSTSLQRPWRGTGPTMGSHRRTAASWRSSGGAPPGRGLGRHRPRANRRLTCGAFLHRLASPIIAKPLNHKKSTQCVWCAALAVSRFRQQHDVPDVHTEAGALANADALEYRWSAENARDEERALKWFTGLEVCGPFAARMPQDVPRTGGRRAAAQTTRPGAEVPCPWTGQRERDVVRA